MVNDGHTQYNNFPSNDYNDGHTQYNNFPSNDFRSEGTFLSKYQSETIGKNRNTTFEKSISEMNHEKSRSFNNNQQRGMKANQSASSPIAHRTLLLSAL